MNAQPDFPLFPPGEPCCAGMLAVDDLHGMRLFYRKAHDSFTAWIPVPAVIVQGGHDVITPPETAYRLHQAWPGSVMRVVPDAGHAPTEPGTRARLIQALEQFRMERQFA